MDSYSQIEQLLRAEEIVFTEEFKKKFLKVISKIPNYEEEETKVKPKFIVGKNLTEIFSTISSKFILKVEDGDQSGSDFEKKMKTLIPFCNLGWYVFIDFKDERISYGLVRSYSGPQGLTLIEELNEMSNIICIESSSGTCIKFFNLKSEELNIDFKLYSDENAEDQECAIENLAEDIVAETEEKYKTDLFKVFHKLLKIAQPKIHGTILLVVDHNLTKENIPSQISDGVWLDSPLNLSDSATKLISTQDMISNELHYSLTGLFIQMLDIDGITVINNKGSIIAYSVFLKHTDFEESQAIGGARKRTALGLKGMGNPHILGVYFQSQDGHYTYERIERS